MTHRIITDSARFGSKDKAHYAGLDSLADQADAKEREDRLTVVFAMVAFVVTFVAFHIIGA